MKRLLLLIFPLLLAFRAFGANPSYEAFIGTNGIIVTSNPPQGRVIIDGRLLTNGLPSMVALLWTNEPAGRIHPIEFTNRVELQRVLVIGTNYASFAGPVNSNDFLFAYRDITKGERWGPRFEIGVFSNSVASRIFYSLNHNSTVMDIVTTDEGANSSSISMAATANTAGPSLTLTRTNGTLPFAVSGTNTTLHNVQYTFPQAQGASGTVLTNNGAGVLGWGTVVGGAGSGLTNIFTPSPSNAIMKPLVVGVGDANGATNTTGHIRGLEAGSGIDLVENGTNVVISVQGSVVSFTDLVWTNDNGTLKPLAFPTNILLTVNVPDNGTGTNFYFDSRVYRTNAASKLFAIYNGGSNAVTVGPHGGLFMGRNNETPTPGVALSGIYDTALGETNQQEIFVMSQNSAVGYLGAVDLLVDTNYGAIIMTAQNAGATRFSRWSIQAGAGENPQAFGTFTMQALVDGATYFQVDPNFTSQNPTNYLFSSSVRITNIHTLMSLQNSNTPVFEVDGVGDLRMIKRVAYIWPSSQGAAQTVLTNDGAGNLGWGAVAGGAASTLRFTNQLWVELTGNDATGARNDPSKPFRTMTNAMAATIPGDVINVGVGRFTNLAGPLTISNSVTVRGVDWNNTVLLGTNGWTAIGPNFKPQDNCTIEHLRLEIATDMSVVSVLFGRNSSVDSGGFTNVTVRNVRFVGFTDNVIVLTGASDPCTTQFIDCEFDTGGDMVVLHGSADSHLKFQRCHFYGHTNNVNGVNSSALRASTGNCTYEFCNFASTNNGPVVKGLELISTAGARLESCTFNMGCTSGNVSNLMSTSSRPVVLVNCLVTTNSFSGYVIQEPAFVQGVAAGANITITTNSDAVVTIAAGAGGGVAFSDLVWTNTGVMIVPVTTAATALRHGVTNGTQWAVTNVGVLSVAFGSNNAAGGYISSILGGTVNTISTITRFSVIVGGEGNSMGDSGGGANFIGGGRSHQIDNTSSNSVIVGGNNNRIQSNGRQSFIGGGADNECQQLDGAIVGGSGNTIVGTAGFIGAGSNNTSGNDSGDEHNTVAGGSANNTQGDWQSIGGGQGNLIQSSATSGTIAGGRGNVINGPDSNVGGGALNQIENLGEGATIGGGYTNYISTGSSAIYATIPGGVSNRVNSAPMAWTLGSFGTNATPNSILLSPAGTHGSNLMHITATATTNMGPLKVQMGKATTAYAGVGGVLWSTNFPIFNAGVAETNLVSITIPAHTLSNLNSSLIIEASGSMAAATAGTNQIRILFGSQVLMDTGLQTASNGWYRIRATISSSALTAGFTNQFTTADHFWWGTGVTGMPFRDTNFNTWTTQTNGINTTLSLATTSRRNGGITNESFRVRWVPNSP
jgi:hypothetical protein